MPEFETIIKLLVLAAGGTGVFLGAGGNGDGAGAVCQVNRGECEIILCQDARRRDKVRRFIELAPEGLTELRHEIAERSVPGRESWWGDDVVQVDDPDGNELLFPVAG